MTKKKNTAVKAQEQNSTQPDNPIELITKQLVEAGATNALIIAMKDDETLLMNSTLPSYEQMHSLINRGMIELVIGHNKYILSQLSKETE